MRKHVSVFIIAITAITIISFISEKPAVKGNSVLELQLIEPAGHSPKIFDKGWVLGVKCLMYPDSENEQDITDNVHWSGTGQFYPEYGKETRPVFNSIGNNTVTLTCTVNGREIKKTFYFETVNSNDYAAFGDRATCNSDSHGCPSCPHTVQGYIIALSETVFIGEKPAARVGDGGIHVMPCCGDNKFVIAEGDENVLIDGYPAARLGDKTEHCGGIGKIDKLFRSEE